eukprot:CAMPEP_0174264722 /NCGR_PEP_ID=MMETSP0439-20130205/23627_1 /TAXON_ID=0 /ORGANISM="Stereomyxa ramosa, Strain Chinc5" /LENGTH=358 /DNA_ID=CAMNT_0015350755 /DNA_START=13 /DNA_END=1090 /DNA_ORIENTATION=-
MRRLWLGVMVVVVVGLIGGVTGKGLGDYVMSLGSKVRKTVDQLKHNFCDCSKPLNSYLCPNCYGSCGVHPNPVHNFVRSTNHLFGQEQAVKTIHEALTLRDGTKPVILHFVGPNGVGKSYTGMMLTEAFYPSGGVLTQRKGVLWISGKSYKLRTTDQEISQTRLEIKKMILNQLEKCEESIIVFDECEEVNAKILGVLESFMDDSNPLVPSLDGLRNISTKKALFILISDFGSEKVRAGESWEEALDFVNAVTLKILRSEKMVSLITHIIPFLPVSAVNCSSKEYGLTQPVVGLVTNLLSKIEEHQVVINNDIEIDQFHVNHNDLALYLLHRLATSGYCYMNYGAWKDFSISISPLNF